MCMDKQKADEIITEYMPRLYGFAVRKSFSYAEAEEICSDIICELYSSLLKADEVCNIDGYICRISDRNDHEHGSNRQRY